MSGLPPGFGAGQTSEIHSAAFGAAPEIGHESPLLGGLGFGGTDLDGLLANFAGTTAVHSFVDEFASPEMAHEYSGVDIAHLDSLLGF